LLGTSNFDFSITWFLLLGANTLAGRHTVP